MQDQNSVLAGAGDVPQASGPTFYSLYYVATYLALTGLALMTAPIAALKLLGATGTYEPVMSRTVGVFMVALSMLVVQIIRHRLDVMKKTTVFVRLFFLTSFAGIYATCRDPLFIVILGVVSLGVILTVVEMRLRPAV